MKRISIIIPVHNVEKYLRKCLESIIPQITEQDEILLINDNSTDSSTEICEEYSRKYSNIYTEYGKNGGPSKTRNIGIDKAQGKYILFIDSDDYLHKDYIKKMLENIDNYQLKVCCYSFVYEESKKVKKQKYFEKSYNNGIEIPKESFIKLYHRQLLNIVWNKIYYTNIIKENNIRFDENVTKGEDLLFNLDYILHINTSIGIINESLYYYVSKSSGLNRGFREPIEDRMQRTNRIYQKMKKISTKHNNQIIAEIINLYFIHLRDYKREKNIKKPRKIWIELLDRPEVKTMIEEINEKNEKPNLKHIKKSYFKKNIYTMFLENKLRLVLEREW